MASRALGLAMLAVVSAAMPAPNAALGSPNAALRVLGVQVLTVPGDTKANLARAAALIRAHPGYDLYVLPELSCCGYDASVLSRKEEEAEELLDATEGGRAGTFFADLACEAKAHICYGFLRRTSSGETTICQAVASPTGLACAYDKMHLCEMGACSEVGFGLSPGAALATFECGGVRVGLTVCYDLRFPELYRALAWSHGCDLILHPSAFVRDATFPAYHTFVTTRAIENGVYVLSVNHAGEQFGDSIAAPPWLGPVPGLDAELAPSTLGTEEGVLPLVVAAEELEAVRRAYPYRRNVHPTLRERDAQRAPS